MPKFTDDLDRAIVRLLEEDGRLPNLEIARRLGVSEATVRKRIARLIQQNGMRIVASLDGSSRMTEMLFLIHAEAGCRIAVADRLTGLPDVRQVSLTTGGYDIVVRAAFRSDGEALDFLVEHLEGAEGVRSVQASHVLKNLLPAGDAVGAAAGRQQAPRAALDAFVREAARTADLKSLLNLACDTALGGLGADRMAVFFLDETTKRPLYQISRGLSEDYVKTIPNRISPRVGVGVRVINTHVHVYVEDALTSPLFAGMQDLVQREGYRSALFLPLLYGEDLIGTLSLYNDTVRRYSDDEIALAQAFADQLAIEVVRIRKPPAVADGQAGASLHEPANSPIELLMDRLAGLTGS